VAPIQAAAAAANLKDFDREHDRLVINRPASPTYLEGPVKTLLLLLSLLLMLLLLAVVGILCLSHKLPTLLLRLVCNGMIDLLLL